MVEVTNDVKSSEFTMKEIVIFCSNYGVQHEMWITLIGSYNW